MKTAYDEHKEILQEALNDLHAIHDHVREMQRQENRAVVAARWQATQDFIDCHWLLKFEQTLSGA